MVLNQIQILVLMFCCFYYINGEKYTYEDVELRRLFPNEFPQDVPLKSNMKEPLELGRYQEVENYFYQPKLKENSHFEELVCYKGDSKKNNKVCKIDLDRYTPEEDKFYQSLKADHRDPSRVYCLFLICFTENELDRVIASL